MRQPVPFGKYLLLDRVSVGGMAEVFKAKSYGVEGFEKVIAIKRILPSMGEDRQFIKMFIDEAKIAGQLSHANICQIFELGRIQGAHFIAMEYIWGKDLLQIQNRFRKRKEQMPVEMACYVVSKLCEGLHYAHKRKDALGRPLEIVHRDCSPQNVLVSYEGEVKLIDFGIAKAASRSSRTNAGVLKGKFGYMSPEQVRGLPLDRRSDIFAIGTVLYESLTGSRLFLGESDFSTLEKVRNADLVPPSEHNKDIPPEVEAICMKALAKDAKDRYQWCAEMNADLRRYLASQAQPFTSRQLSGWLKVAFAAELNREKDLMEKYKRVGRDGLIAGVPQAKAKLDVDKELGSVPDLEGDPTVLGGPEFDEEPEPPKLLSTPPASAVNEPRGRVERVGTGPDFEEGPTEIFGEISPEKLEEIRRNLEQAEQKAGRAAGQSSPVGSREIDRAPVSASGGPAGRGPGTPGPVVQSQLSSGAHPTPGGYGGHGGRTPTPAARPGPAPAAHAGQQQQQQQQQQPMMAGPPAGAAGARAPGPQQPGLRRPPASSSGYEPPPGAMGTGPASPRPGYPGMQPGGPGGAVYPAANGSHGGGPGYPGGHAVPQRGYPGPQGGYPGPQQGYAPQGGTGQSVDPHAASFGPRPAPAYPTYPPQSSPPRRKRRSRGRDIAIGLAIASLAAGLFVGAKWFFTGASPGPTVAQAESATIAVVIDGTPSAKVILNGEPKGEIGADGHLALELEPNEYEIEVHPKSGVPCKKKVALEPNGVEVVRCEFSPSDPNVGVLLLEQLQDGDRVLVDDEEVSAEAAREPLRLEPDVKHQVVVQRGDSELARFEIDLAAGETVRKQVKAGAELENAPAPRDDSATEERKPDANDAKTEAGSATTEAASEQKNAVASSESSSPAKATETKTGGALAGTKRGKPDEKRTTPGASEQAAGDFGYVVVYTDPSGLPVYIDGRNSGRRTPIPPRKRLRLSAGRHTIGFRVDGQTRKFPLVVKPGEVKHVNKKLTR